MRTTQLSPHIWSVRAWVGFSIHVWLVAEPDGVTLVDAGIPLMTKAITRAVEQMGAGPIRRVLLTHGHGDHVGAIPALTANGAVPVLAHRIELPYLEGRDPYPRRRKAVAFLRPGLATPLPERADGGLEPVGSLTPYLTPGHSPGHVVYHHEQDDVLLAGDLFTARNGRLRRPMAIFTADMAQALESAAIVDQLRPARLEASHGGSVPDPASQIAAYLRAAARPVTG